MTSSDVVSGQKELLFHLTIWTHLHRRQRLGPGKTTVAILELAIGHTHIAFSSQSSKVDMLVNILSGPKLITFSPSLLSRTRFLTFYRCPSVWVTTAENNGAFAVNINYLLSYSAPLSYVCYVCKKNYNRNDNLYCSLIMRISTQEKTGDIDGKLFGGRFIKALCYLIYMARLRTLISFQIEARELCF